VVEPPATTLRLAGEIDTEKSGGELMVRVRAVLWVALAAVPVTVRV
jgi:hypothetical protein